MSFLASTLLGFALAATAPIQSKEEIKFITNNENKFLGTFKSKAFVGTIGRVDEKSQELSMVDLYAFGESGKIAMDETLCNAFLQQIYGPFDANSLNLKELKIYTSHTGKTCEAQVDDPDQQSPLPERRIILGFIKAKPYAIEFSLSKKSTSDVQDNTRKFWESLR